MNIQKLLLSFASLALVIACGGSNSSNESSGPQGAQNSFRMSGTLNKALGATLPINQVPEGTFLLESILYTMDYPTFDVSYLHALSTLGDVDENDQVQISRLRGEGANNFGIAIPLEIHSTPEEVIFVDMRNYSGGFDYDDSFNWTLNARDEYKTFPDHLGPMLKEALLSADGAYRATPQSMSFSYTIAIQSVDERLFISVFRQSPEPTPEVREERYLLTFKKGDTFGPEPKSYILKK